MIFPFLLFSKEFTLNISTKPSDAKVEIEGMLEDYYRGMKLKAGKYKIKVFKNGYKTKKGTIKLNKNYNLKISLNRTKKSKQEMKILIDGKLMWQDDRDSVKLMKSEFQANRYCEKLKLEGYSDWKLPTNEMLNVLKNKKSKLKNSLDDVYWSDYGKVTFSFSQVDAFQEPTGFGVGPEEEHYVRCVREK